MNTKHVSILVMRGNLSVVNVEGTLQILSDVNSPHEAPLFDVHLVGINPQGIQDTSPFSVCPDCLMQEVPETDLIVIPAVHDDHLQVIERNRAFIPWIIDQHRRGAEIASLCVGAFFLAATGLLNSRHCSTHPAEANLFRRMYPEVLLVDEKIVTAEAGIYTSGGGYSFLNLLLYLVEKYTGHEKSLAIAKAFAIDFSRTSQSHFAVFRGQRDHNDDAVRAVQDFIELHWQKRLSVEQLADQAAIGRRSLERRFKTATGNSVAEYILRAKIEAAKGRLESGVRTVSEVMYDVGYADQSAFRTAFKKITGMTPVQYKNKYKSLL